MKNYETSWGADSNHLIAAPRVDYNALAQRLAEVRAQRCDCTDWLQELAKNYDRLEMSKREYDREKHVQSLIIYWVRTLFQAIRAYADEFNLQLNTDCRMVDYVEPEFHTVQCSEKGHSTAANTIFYEGHFVTQSSALLLRGVDHEIDVFVVPSAAWLGLAINTVDDSQYPPFVRLEIDASRGLRTMFCDLGTNGHFDSESIQVLAKHLFSVLIESSFERSELQWPHNY